MENEVIFTSVLFDLVFLVIQRNIAVLHDYFSLSLIACSPAEGYGILNCIKYDYLMITTIYISRLYITRFRKSNHFRFRFSFRYQFERICRYTYHFRDLVVASFVERMS